MHQLNYLKDKLIWVRRRSGKRELISPQQIGDKYTTDPITRVDFTNPSLNGTTTILLIGLFQVAIAPKTTADIQRLQKRPPKKTALKDLEKYFYLQSAGPIAFQDHLENVEGASEKDIHGIFLNAPGGIAREENKDFFIKDGAVQKICPACAVAGLYAQLSNAATGGVGYRTSIRGRASKGGPLLM